MTVSCEARPIEPSGKGLCDALGYQVGFVVYPGFQLQHVAGPMATFEGVGGFGVSPYESLLVSPAGGIVPSSAHARIGTTAFADAGQFDILFISGGFAMIEAERSAAIADFIRAQDHGCRHVAAAASGTLVLAAAGVLDGRRATTHWSLNGELAGLYPSIDVEIDEAVVRDGRYWTTRSIVGGIEIARLIIEEDLGSVAAKRATRDLLTYYKPHVGSDEDAQVEQRFKDLVRWIRAHLNEPLSIEVLAEQIGMHPRNFVPSFANATGQTPAKAIERIRLEAAFTLVGQSDMPLAEVARQVGFMSTERMRRAFMRAFGVPPLEMRDKLRQRRPRV